METLEDRVVPVSTLSIGNTAYTLSSGAAGYAVARSGDLTPVVDVSYTVSDGTAINGTNYTSATTGIVHFDSGQTTATIPLAILPNTFPEASRTFTVELTSVVDTFGPPATFAAQATFATDVLPQTLVAVDLNGDGRLDLVTGNFIANNTLGTVSVMFNTTAPGAATPTFTAQQSFATAQSTQAVTVGDVNADGKPDLIIANAAGGSVSVLLNMTPTGTTTAVFAPLQNFATSASNGSIAVGDVNGDGRVDFILPNVAGSVSVLLNTTTPGSSTVTMSVPVTFAVGTSPRAVALGDINGDGLLDLLVPNGNSGTLSVLLNVTTPGAPAPSFLPQQTFAMGSIPISVATADVNGDGLTDVLVANYGANAVSVLLNTTAPGAFSASFAAQTLSVGTPPYSVAAADVNGDGRPDLLIANYGTDSVSVLLNSTVPGAAAATFGLPLNLATGDGSYSVVAADVNGDGRLDLLVNNSPDSSVSVLLNTTSHVEATPSGTPEPLFPEAATVATGPGAYSVVTADINGDGKPDLIVANYTNNTVSVMLSTTVPGSLTPTFATQVAFPVGSNPFAVTVDDINIDGRPDLLVVNRSTNNVSVLLNTTTTGAVVPIFAVQATFVTGSTPTSVSTADINLDGLPDMLVANSISNTVSVFINTTAPGAVVPVFATQQTFATGTSPRWVEAGDINGDGLLDLLVANNGSNSASVLINTTNPGAIIATFATEVSFAVGSNPLSITSADINGDGRLDLLLGNVNSNSVSLLLSTTVAGALVPTFAVQQSFATGAQPHTVKVADLNGDGLLDVVVASAAISSATVLLNTTAPGALTASFTQKLFTTGSIPVSIAIDDINGDGRPDLLVANYVSNTISVLLNTPAVISSVTNPATGTINKAVVPTIVFIDLNANGVQNSGEPGLANRTMFLDLNGNDMLDPGETFAVTDSTGAFVISGPGTLRQVLFAGDIVIGGEVATRLNSSLTITPAENVRVNGASTDETFVRRLYLAVLGRDGEQAGVAGWVFFLQAGNSYETVANGFWQSNEHRLAQIDDYYRDYLGRTGEESGRQAGLAAFQAGWSEEQVVTSFLTSAEYQAIHPTDNGFVDSLYSALVGRDANPGEASGWDAQLVTQGRASVITSFLASAETQNRAINGYYEGLLNRMGEPVGSANWLAAMQAGETYGDVAVQFLVSAEFYSVSSPG